ncbi:MAG: response regulator [Methanoregula sp.]|jgi:PAS domain S-box-containing protein|uniref:ATP-binding response regulator n=1 Tax=Methanoregula sp. TaxID=2052170 RepID=UPI0025D32B04|nr:hybrid sensor histidine kinase/response regulator [Methanoregula sp.]MCK9631205.1 response regulator [Methanoregula sp.]
MTSVLYVDDEPDLLYLGKRSMENSGDFSVTTCESASAAMDLLKTSHYDAIISDYQMPEMDGVEFLKNIRLHVGQIPFILFTGKGREDVMIEAINSGADFYLQKGGSPSVQFAELMHKVRQAVSRNEAMQALRESEEKYRFLLDESSDPIFSFYPDGTYRYVNRAFAEGVRKTVDQIIGKKIWDVFDEDEAEKRFSTLRTVFATGKDTEFEVRVPRPDGDRYYVTTIVPIKDEKGSVVSAICSSKEITARRHTEEALRQANKKLSLLSGITRHDINNQLQVLNGYLEILHNQVPDPALEKYFSRIMGASDGISTMIRFTSDYEKIGVHAPVWHDLRALVKKAGTGVTFGQVVLQNDLPANTEVFADPLIFRVFFNMIDNALRHGGKVTTIRFSAELCNENRIIVCEDDGDGVVTEEKEMIFHRGFGKNTGFGLAISREILDITGIAIRETGAPGRGARFEILVPKEAYRHTPEH